MAVGEAVNVTFIILRPFVPHPTYLSNLLFKLRPKFERVMVNILHIDAGIVIRGQTGGVPRTSGRQLRLFQQRHLHF